jgi:hypothetical protein
MKNYEVGAPFDVHHSLFLVQYSNPAGSLGSIMDKQYRSATQQKPNSCPNVGLIKMILS